jgi:hypothetical protein
MNVKIVLEHVAFSCYRSRALILREVLILWYRESLSGDAFFPNRNMVASCLGRDVRIHVQLPSLIFLNYCSD